MKSAPLHSQLLIAATKQVKEDEKKMNIVFQPRHKSAVKKLDIRNLV